MHWGAQSRWYWDCKEMKYTNKHRDIKKSKCKRGWWMAFPVQLPEHDDVHLNPFLWCKGWPLELRGCECVNDVTYAFILARYVISNGNGHCHICCTRCAKGFERFWKSLKHITLYPMRVSTWIMTKARKKLYSYVLLFNVSITPRIQCDQFRNFYFPRMFLKFH